jgi:L-ascorbate metabolism protein UlaG (beta-lactamase superfamily)
MTRSSPTLPNKPFTTSERAPSFTPLDNSTLRLTFVGHATFLIETEGVAILTDPIWSDRASPFSWIGPKRYSPPGVDFSELPRIASILITHNHYDHLDIPTLISLVERDNPLIITFLGNDSIIHQAIPSARVVALDWGEKYSLSPAVSIHGEPSLHWSARGLLDRNKALWGAFVMRTPHGNAYFVGDSAFGSGELYQKIRETYGPLRVAILPIGAYAPRWFMAGVHMSPDEASQAFRLLGSPTTYASHFDTFPLADEEASEAPRLLKESLKEGEKFEVLTPGEQRVHIFPQSIELERFSKRSSRRRMSAKQ